MAMVSMQRRHLQLHVRAKTASDGTASQNCLWMPVSTAYACLPG
jgi:hypothetical protein